MYAGSFAPTICSEGKKNVEKTINVAINLKEKKKQQPAEIHFWGGLSCWINPFNATHRRPSFAVPSLSSRGMASQWRSHLWRQMNFSLRSDEVADKIEKRRNGVENLHLSSALLLESARDCAQAWVKKKQRLSRATHLGCRVSYHWLAIILTTAERWSGGLWCAVAVKNAAKTKCWACQTSPTPAHPPAPSPCPPTRFANQYRRVCVCWGLGRVEFTKFFFFFVCLRAVSSGTEPHGRLPSCFRPRLLKEPLDRAELFPPTCNKDVPWLTGAWIHARIFTSFRFIEGKTKTTGAAPAADPTSTVVYLFCCKMQKCNCFVSP